MDVVLLHNQKAGDGDRSMEELSTLLRRHGYRPEAFSLKDALQRSDPLERGEFVVVAGGDGSVRQVATRLAHRGRAVAPLPMGTANNIATSLGICGTPEEVIAGWKGGSRRRIDLGRAKGPWGERHFIEGLGLGLIGRAISTLDGIDEASAREFSSKEDKLYRDLCVLYTLAKEMPPLPIGVVQDGTDRNGSYLLLEILNISRAGPGFELAQRADPSDGSLNVVSVDADERGKLLDSVKRCLSALDHGTILESQPARNLRLELSRGELRLDDDIVWPTAASRKSRDGREPVVVEVSVDPAAVEFVLPASST